MPHAAQVPTFKPQERTAAMNMLASAIGDTRAAGVRRKYGRPFNAVIILGAKELSDAAPSEAAVPAAALAAQ